MRVISINNNLYNTCNYDYRRKQQFSTYPKVTPLKQDTVSFKAKSPLTPEQMKEIADLKILSHHIYEYKKGIRPLFLETLNSKYREAASKKLEKDDISFYISEAGKENINIFFGEKPCVEVVKTLNPKLNEHTPQEDFILGVLLGYDKVKQCTRYLEKCFKPKKKPLE